VEVHFAIFVRKQLFKVKSEVVTDGLPRRAQGYDLLQKGDELTAGMAGSGFAVDATGGGIERCI
jgi:hypothetical protein